MKLTTVYAQVPIKATKEKAWNTLIHYTDVATFHSVVHESRKIGQEDQGMGAERWCRLDDGVEVWERIIDWNEGTGYTYDIYKWKKFPLKKMHSTFEIIVSSNDNIVYLRNTAEYKLSPGFLTFFMKGKLRSALRDSLLAYKNFIETEEKNADIHKLRIKYKNL